MDKLQLFLRKDLLLQQLLEVISAQIHNPVYREWQLHLRTPKQVITQLHRRVQQESTCINEGAPFMTDGAKINAFSVYFYMMSHCR